MLLFIFISSSHSGSFLSIKFSYLILKKLYSLYFFKTLIQSISNACTYKESGDKIDHYSSNILHLELNVYSMSMVDTGQIRISFMMMERMGKL